MTSAYQSTPYTGPMGWLGRADAWLDSKGKGAWIAAMVLGFVFFWPVGLALLFYMIWSKRMFSCKQRRSTDWTPRGFSTMTTSSGNSAFDAYKADTLRRLEQEQDDFQAFLQRLRDAKDKAEFDQFMSDRDRAARESDAADDDDRPSKDA
jgi:hypothetical protein